LLVQHGGSEVEVLTLKRLLLNVMPDKVYCYLKLPQSPKSSLSIIFLSM